MTPPASEEGDHGSLPDAEAFVAVAMSAVWADGSVGSGELETLRRGLALAGPSNLGDAERGNLLVQARDRYADQGRDALLASAADTLGPDLSVQGFALAVDIALADEEVTEEELTFLEDLRDALGIPDERAQPVLDTLSAKHARPIRPPVAPDQPAGDRAVEVAVGEAEALAAVLVRATKARSDAPGQVTADDLPPVRGLEQAQPQARQLLLRRVQRRLEDAGELAYLEACAEALDEEASRQAFVLAADALFADRRLTEPEHSLLSDLRELLGVAPDEAAEIADAVWRKHAR